MLNVNQTKVSMNRSLFTSYRNIFSNKVNLSRVRLLFRILAIALGGLHTYAAIKSQSMNADGVAYLDIGDAYFRADWTNAVNAVWSPLYSWILGFVNFVFNPSMEWEFPTVHVVNFIIYLGALASFEFMWGNVRKDDANDKSYRLPDWLWWTLGYLLFIWTSLNLIQIWSVTPDMLMASFVLLAAGIISKIRSGEENNRLLLSLGLVLGLGYLSKTFMFSIALVSLGLAWFVQKRSRISFIKTLLAVSIFLLVSMPFILLISESKGKFTIGEAGTVTYLRYVNGMPFPHWQGNPLEGIVPTHPSRIIHQSPDIYEFGGQVGGTYPISTDPSYWYEGIEPRLDFRSLLARMFASSLVYLGLFFQKQGGFVACVMALYVMGQRQQLRIDEFLRRWALSIPAIIAFMLYGMVLVQDRYVGVFVLLFWVDILSNIRLAVSANNKLWLNVLGVIASFGLLINILMFNLDGFNRLNPPLEAISSEQTAPSAKPLAVAQTLKGLGVKPGDKVGVIGYAYDSFWARLARVKIVAEMLEEDAMGLWYGDDVLQQEVLQSFASVDVKAVVAEYVPSYYVQLSDWHRVGASNYYVYRFVE